MVALQTHVAPSRSPSGPACPLLVAWSGPALSPIVWPLPCQVATMHNSPSLGHCCLHVKWPPACVPDPCSPAHAWGGPLRNGKSACLPVPLFVAHFVFFKNRGTQRPIVAMTDRFVVPPAAPKYVSVSRVCSHTLCGAPPASGLPQDCGGASRLALRVPERPPPPHPPPRAPFPQGAYEKKQPPLPSLARGGAVHSAGPIEAAG